MHLWLRVIHLRMTRTTGRGNMPSIAMISRGRAHMPSIAMTGRGRTHMPRISPGRMIRRRPCYRRRRRPAMIRTGILTAIVHRRLLMLLLHGCAGNMVVAHRRLLLRTRPGLYPARSAIEARTARPVVDHRPVDISIMYNGGIDPGDSRIVPEMTAIPAAADIPDTAIAETIVDAPIEAYMRAPIAGMPAIYSGRKTPIARRPKKSYFRRSRPIAGYPIITVIPIGPITGYPKISIRGTRRLFVYRNSRRRNSYRQANANLRVHVRGREACG